MSDLIRRNYHNKTLAFRFGGRLPIIAVLAIITGILASCMTPEKYILKASPYRERHQYEKAIEIYNEGLVRYPKSQSLKTERDRISMMNHNDLAYQYMEQGRKSLKEAVDNSWTVVYDKGVSNYTRAIMASNNEKTEYENAIMAFNTALSESDSAIAIAENNISLRNTTDYKSAERNRANALSRIKEIQRLQKEQAEIHLQLELLVEHDQRAAMFISQEQYDRAIAEYDEMLRIHPGNTTIMYNRRKAVSEKEQAR